MEREYGREGLRIEGRHRRKLEEYHRARNRDDADTLLRILDEAEVDPALARLIDSYHEEVGPPLEVPANLLHAARVFKLQAFGGLASVALSGAGAWLEGTALFAGEPAFGDLTGTMSLLLIGACWALLGVGLLGALVGALGWLRVAFRVNRAAGSGLARFIVGPALAATGFLAAAAVAAYVAGATLWVA